MAASLTNDIFECENFQKIDDKLTQTKVSSVIVVALSLACLSAIALMSKNMSQGKYLLAKKHMIVIYSSSTFLGVLVGLTTLVHQTSLRQQFIQDRVEWQEELEEGSNIKSSSPLDHSSENLPIAPIEEDVRAENVISSIANLRLWTSRNFSHLQNMVTLALGPERALVVMEAIKEGVVISEQEGARPICLKESVEGLIAQHDELIIWITENKAFIKTTLSNVLVEQNANDVMEKIDFYLSSVDQAKKIIKEYQGILDHCHELILALPQNQMDLEQRNHLTGCVDRLFNLLKKDLFYAFVTDQVIWDEENQTSLKAALSIPLQLLAKAFGGEGGSQAIELIFQDQVTTVSKSKKKKSFFSSTVEQVEVTRSGKFLNVTLSAIVGCSSIFGVDPTRVVSQQMEERLWRKLFEEHPFLEGFCERTQLKNECDEIFRHLVFQLFVNTGNRAKYRLQLQTALHKELSTMQGNIVNRLGPQPEVQAPDPQLAEREPNPPPEVPRVNELPLGVPAPINPDPDNNEIDVEPPSQIQKPFLPTVITEELKLFLTSFTKQVNELNQRPDEEQVKTSSSNIMAHSAGYASLQLVDRRVNMLKWSSLTLFVLSTLAVALVIYLAKKEPPIFSPSTLLKIKIGLATTLSLGGIGVAISLIMQNRLQKEYIDFYMKNYSGHLKTVIDLPLQPSDEIHELDNRNIFRKYRERVEAFQSFAAKKRHLIQLVKGEVGPERVATLVTKLQEVVKSQQEISWMIHNQVELKKFAVEVLGEENADHFQEICKSIFSTTELLFQELVRNTPDPIQIPQAENTHFHLLPNPFREIGQSIFSLAPLFFQEFERNSTDPVVENALLQLLPYPRPLSVSLKGRLQQYNTFVTSMNNIQELLSLAKVIGGSTAKGYTAKTFALLKRSEVLMAKYETIVKWVGDLLLAIPQETVDQIKGIVSNSVTRNDLVRNLNELNRNVQLLQNQMHEGFVSTFINKPKFWTEQWQFSIKNIWEPYFWLVLSSCGKNGEEIEAALASLPPKEGRFFAMVAQSTKVWKNYSGEEFNILELSCLPYTEAFKKHFSIPKQINSRVGIALAKIEAVSQELSGMFPTFANYAAPFTGVTSYSNARLIMMAINNRVFTPIEVNETITGYIHETKIKTIIYSIIISLDKALIKTPGYHLSYRGQLIEALRSEIDVWEKTLMGMIQNPIDYNFEEINLDPLMKFLSNMLTKIAEIKEQEAKKGTGVFARITSNVVGSLKFW